MQYIINRLKRVIKSTGADLDLNSCIAREDYSSSKSSDDELRRIIDSLVNEKPEKKFTGENKRFTYQNESNQENKQEKTHKPQSESKIDKEALKSALSILGVKEDASIVEIKEAYRKLLMKFHPDKTGKLGKDLQEIGSQKTQELIYAYNVLKRFRGFN